MFSNGVLVVVLLALWKEGMCCSQTNLVLQNGQVYTFTSLNFPNIYPNTAHSCTFQGTAPVGQLIYVYCDTFNIAYDAQCANAPFYFSPSGNPSYTDASIYCGYFPSLSLVTNTNQISMTFQNKWYDPYRQIGTFRCYVGTWPSTTSTTTTTTSTTSTTSTTTRTPTTTRATTKTPTTTRATTQTPTTTRATTPTTTTTTTTSGPPTVCECGRKNGATRIVGGQETSISEYPWMVGLMFVGEKLPYCGGTLIANQWVLAASHCVQPFLNTGIEVVLGAQELGENIQSGYRVQVIQKIIHENYDIVTVDNDIALLKLAQPVSYTTNVSPVCLPFKFPDSDFEGEMGTATGWGTLSYQGVRPVSLQEVDLPILSEQTCDGYYINRTPPTVLTSNMFCTLAIGKDACQGDSGGPLTITSGGRLYEVGVISWGIECATPDNPGVYAKVNNYLQWIETKTGANFCKV